MTSENKDKIRYKVNINDHLRELNCFTKKKMDETNLLPLEKTKNILDQSHPLFQMASHKFSIPFLEKGSERFKKYIDSLQKANPSGAYIWINRTNDCGTSMVNSLFDINWNFDFNCTENGIFVLEAIDLQDRILFDFFEADGKNHLEIDVKGFHWPQISW